MTHPGSAALRVLAIRPTSRGFGFAVLPENGYSATPRKPGTYAWGGVFSTTYWVDPKEHLLVLLYEQMWGPYVGQTQKLFSALVYQAITN